MKNVPLIERFWSRVDTSGDCWNWTGTYGSGNQYGQVSLDGTRKAATHRLSYEMAYGTIPAGMSVCHSCDNPRRVRPSHLFLGTRADNCRDMWSKGRGVNPPLHVGDANPNAKLTRVAADEIRHIHSLGGVTMRQLAQKYGVSPSLIRLVVIGKVWK